MLLAALALGGGLLFPAYRDALRYESSLPALEAEAVRHPGDASLQVQVALRRLAAEEFDRATESLRHAVDAGSRDEGVWRLWAAQVAAVGERAEVGAIFQKAASVAAVAPALKVAAERFQALPENASGLDRAQAICPEGAEPLAARYSAPNFLSGWLERPEGRVAAERAVMTTPEDPTAIRRWARALLPERRFSEAAQALEGLAQASQEDRILLGRAYEGMGRYADALVLYQEMLRANPESLPALLGAGRCATTRRMYFLGVEYGRQAVARAPKSADAWAILGRAYRNQTMRWDKAAEAFAKALALDPERLEDYGAHYETLKSLGRYEDAEALLRRRLAQDPEDGMAHYLLAAALLDNRADAAREGAAEEHLVTALRLQPNLTAAQVRLGQLLLRRGAYDEAIARLTKAWTRDRYHPQAAALLARALRLAGRTTDAATMEARARQVSAYLAQRTPLEDALNREPTDRGGLRNLLAVYRRGGEEEKAAKVERTLAALEAGGALP